MIQPYLNTISYQGFPEILAPDNAPDKGTGRAIAAEFGINIPPGDAHFHRILIPSNSDYDYTGTGEVGFLYGNFPGFKNLGPLTGSIPVQHDAYGVPLTFARLHCCILRIRLIDPTLPFGSSFKIKTENGFISTGNLDFEVENPTLFVFGIEDPNGWEPAPDAKIRATWVTGAPPNACLELFLSGVQTAPV